MPVKAIDVLDIIKSEFGVVEEPKKPAPKPAPKKLETVKTSSLATTKDFSSTLVEPFEEGFMDGYELKTPTGGKITLNHIWDAYKGGENILLVGPSGSGKSTIAFHLLDRANEDIRLKNVEIKEKNETLKEEEKHPYYKLPYEISHFSCHEATRSESLIGSLTIKVNKDGSREPIIVHGAVLEAWTKGKTLILEEMDFAPAGVWGETHQFFDGRTKETTVYINGPERVRKHPNFRVIATANTLGSGENQIEYSGTQILNRAFMNRFTYIVHVSYMKSAYETKLIHEKTGLSMDTAEKMVAAAKRTREAHDEGIIDCAITTRDILSWAKECLREEKRRRSSSVTGVAYWQEVAIPSASPAFLNRIADKTVLDTMASYLRLR